MNVQRTLASLLWNGSGGIGVTPEAGVWGLHFSQRSPCDMYKIMSIDPGKRGGLALSWYQNKLPNKWEKITSKADQWIATEQGALINMPDERTLISIIQRFCVQTVILEELPKGMLYTQTNIPSITKLHQHYGFIKGAIENFTVARLVLVNPYEWQRPLKPYINRNKNKKQELHRHAKISNYLVTLNTCDAYLIMKWWYEYGKPESKM